MAKSTHPLTVTQLQQHPELKNAIWDLKPIYKGEVDVVKGTIDQIVYNIHNDGEHRLALYHC